MELVLQSLTSERLKSALYIEEQLELASRVIQRGDNTKKGAKILLDQAVPYMLHMEMWIGKNIVQILLSQGIEKCGASSPSS